MTAAEGSSPLAALQQLVARGFCAPERYEAIANWGGIDWSDELLGQRVLRLPNHFKTRISDDGRIADKMYLGAFFLPPLVGIDDG